MTAAAPQATGPAACAALDLRRVVPTDADALTTFIARLSPAARRRRFLGPVTPAGAARALVDRSVGVIATTSDGGQIVGHGCFVAGGDGRAEIGVAVLDAWQRRGIGEQLLRGLAALAGKRGASTLVARLGSANEGIVEAMADAGVALTARYDGDVLVIEAPVELDGHPAPAFSDPAPGA